MKKLLMGLFCGLFAVGTMIGAPVNWDKDFMANFRLLLVELYAKENDGKVDWDKDGWTFGKVEFLSKKHGNLYHGIRNEMQSLCKRMQKYSKENNMDIILRGIEAAPGLAGVNFNNVDCDMNDVLLLYANLDAAIVIDKEQKKRAEQQIKWGNENKDMLIAEKLIMDDLDSEYGTRCGYNLARYLRPKASIQDTKIICSQDGAQCIVIQDVLLENGTMAKYQSCCNVSWDSDSAKIDFQANYDDVYITKFHVERIDIIPGYSKLVFSEKELLDVSDFGPDCNALISQDVYKPDRKGMW